MTVERAIQRRDRNIVYDCLSQSEVTDQATDTPLPYENRILTPWPHRPALPPTPERLPLMRSSVQGASKGNTRVGPVRTKLKRVRETRTQNYDPVSASACNDRSYTIPRTLTNDTREERGKGVSEKSLLSYLFSFHPDES